MAAVSEVASITANLLLNNGTNSNGSKKLVSVALPKLSTTNYTDAKAVAIRDLLAQCLDLEVEDFRKVVTSSVYDDGSN